MAVVVTMIRAVAVKVVVSEGRAVAKAVVSI